MSSDDNLIYFTSSKKRDKNKKKESFASSDDNLLDFPGSKKRDHKQDYIESGVKRKNDPVSAHSALEQKLEKSEKPDGLKPQQDIPDNQKQSRYTVAAVAIALCLMLVGFPFLTQYNKGNGIRTPADELAEERVQLQEQKALHLIQTGQRKIASIGQKPEIQDIFSITLLQSRYEVRWKKGKLVYAVLLEGQRPVSLSATDELVNQYGALFPAYTDIRKLDSLSGDLEVYELKDTTGLNTAQVEILKDIENRMLSIHVLW